MNSVNERASEYSAGERERESGRGKKNRDGHAEEMTREIKGREKKGEERNEEEEKRNGSGGRRGGDDKIHVRNGKWKFGPEGRE